MVAVLAGIILTLGVVIGSAVDDDTTPTTTTVVTIPHSENVIVPVKDEPTTTTTIITPGWYFWENNPCRPDVWWMATESGVWYWTEGFSEANGAKLVEYGNFMDVYSENGYQCGWLGHPTSNVYFNGRGWTQWFQHGWIAFEMH